MKKEVNMKKAIIGLVQQILEFYEFELLVIDSKFALEDLQHANLGGIEEERFDNLAEVLDRLSTYHDDYIYKAIEDGYSEWDFLVIDFLESEKAMKLSKEITTKDIIGYEEYNFSIIKEFLKTDAQQIREKIRKELYKRISLKKEQGFKFYSISEYVFLYNIFEALVQNNLSFFENSCKKLNINLKKLNKIENIFQTMWDFQKYQRTTTQTLSSDDFFEILKNI
jgi:hypothetical protein